MAISCQFSAICAMTMIALVLAAAIATLTSVITATEPPTPGKNCYRKCIPGDKRTCHFIFEVHPYQTMSRACYNCPVNATDCNRPDCIPGDGVQRRIKIVNRQMPGPHIQVCEGDKIVVDVKNSLPNEGLTLHWHGLTQLGPQTTTSHPSASIGRNPSSYGATPFMDGVPGITQCPIHSMASFRYSFHAMDAGTHFWHSHTGFQRGDGVFGPLTVRQPPAKDPHIGLYDHDLPEHNIFLHDWLHAPTEDKFVLRHHSGGDDFPESMLVNGRGPHQHINSTQTSANIPYSRFKVTPGNRYRMRIINAGILNCPITVHIDQHDFTIIESDGNPLRPFNTSSLIVYPGERWDIVVSASPDKSGAFWMSFMGGVDCAMSAAHQFAILEYDSSVYGRKGVYQYTARRASLDDQTLLRTMKPKPVFTEVPPTGIQVNSINSDCYEDLVCVADLRSIYEMPHDMRTPRANFTFYLAFEMRRINNIHFYSRMYYDFNAMGEDQQIPTPQINNISFVLPASPLLIDRYQKEGKICNAENPIVNKNCVNDHCECLHMYKVPLGASVELVLIDEGQHGDENHPIHLHGEYFWVLGQERPYDLIDAKITREQVMEMDQRGELKRNFINPAYKDTVTIPDAGYSIVRFRANNPGYWLLHCHLLFHSEAGMSMIFKIGEDHEIPEVPHDFPRCGNYKNTEL